MAWSHRLVVKTIELQRFPYKGDGLMNIHSFDFSIGLCDIKKHRDYARIQHNCLWYYFWYYSCIYWIRMKGQSSGMHFWDFPSLRNLLLFNMKQFLLNKNYNRCAYTHWKLCTKLCGKWTSVDAPTMHFATLCALQTNGGDSTNTREKVLVLLESSHRECI